MKVHLLFSGRNPVWTADLRDDQQQRSRDLELEQLVEAMAGTDDGIAHICRMLLNQPLQKTEEIVYRQEILKDCMTHPDCIRTCYRLCTEAEQRRKKSWSRLTSPHLSTIYSSAADLVGIAMDALEAIRKVLEQETFHSEGLRACSELLQRELSDAYLARVRALPYGTEEQDGTLLSARFGRNLQGVSYVYRRKESGFSRVRWMLAPSYALSEHDTRGEKDLECRRDRAINEAANAMAQACDSLQGFLKELQQELAFYVGALNLCERLTATGMAISFPEMSHTRRWEELYDGSLALLTGKPVVGNTVCSRDCRLCIITGANQGGKTTFLRAVGQCQLMAQCGLFVCARACALPLCVDVFTHFKREEDSGMKSGKLDEELSRMSQIVDRIRPGSLILFNESFSSTNDWEGSALFGQITRALLQRGIQICSVTHLIEYATGFPDRDDVLYLKAQRTASGERTFRMIEQAPEQTAFGEDLYRSVFPEGL